MLEEIQSRVAEISEINNISNITETPDFWLRLLLCVGGFFIAYLFSRLVRYKLMPALVKKLKSGKNKGFYLIANGFSKPAPVFVWTVSFYLACLFLPLPTQILQPLLSVLHKLLNLTLICLFAWGLINSSDVGPLLFHDMRDRLDLEMDTTASNFLNKIIKGVILVFAGLMILQELGVQVDSLIASLGLVGLNVSLAAKDYATNFFGGLVVIMEKPFSIGDWILCPDGEGEVVDISFRSTRIRQQNNTVLVIPNSTLVNNAVTNYTEIEKRLAKFILGIAYQATKEQLDHLMQDIRSMLASRDDVHEDSIRVRFTGFGASSLDLLVQFYTKTGDYGEFLAIQEAVNFELLGLVQKNGCSFAFPSTSVYIEQT